MMQHEKLEVYRLALRLNHEVRKSVLGSNLDWSTKDQIIRALLSIPANIAEGTGRHGAKECRQFYNIARGSVAECLALLDVIGPERWFDRDQVDRWKADFVVISKILFTLIYRSRIPQDCRS